MEALSKRILNQGHNFSITIFEKKVKSGKRSGIFWSV
ncbi:TPA: hypothetical protein MAK88_000871 [Klebsiella aerogenes]|nr:hypothetical protein [Klebsiella aerogenes]